MEPKQAYEILSSKANLEDNVKQALLDVIKTDPEWAYWYARNVIKGRFPEAEEYIKTKPQVNSTWEPKDNNPCAYSYARYIIKGRWPEAEEYIKTDLHSAYYYAENIIQGRWKEAEEYFKTDPKYARWYAEGVIKDKNFWENQAALEEFMNNVPKPKSKSNNELNDVDRVTDLQKPLNKMEQNTNEYRMVYFYEAPNWENIIDDDDMSKEIDEKLEQYVEDNIDNINGHNLCGGASCFEVEDFEAPDTLNGILVFNICDGKFMKFQIRKSVDVYSELCLYWTFIKNKKNNWEKIKSLND